MVAGTIRVIEAFREEQRSGQLTQHSTVCASEMMAAQSEVMVKMLTRLDVSEKSSKGFNTVCSYSEVERQPSQVLVTTQVARQTSDLPQVWRATLEEGVSKCCNLPPYHLLYMVDIVVFSQ